ncbi:MAG: hypothetical protein WCR58_08985 [Bacteroidales bacterium]|jgi:hypothetical protein|nr:hypothetical protein [Bacteroidales bacterium]MDD3701416.1 hypothetical protein [Bacteroidales bacterium]MDY0369509.1 hypothetical protein [Bacteroidales bacterium]
MSKKHLLSKSTYIRSLQCQKSLYLHVKRPFLRDKLPPEQIAKFRRGTNIGVIARDLFPGGVNMSPRSPSQYQKMREETARLIENQQGNIVYEAIFQHDDVLIMLDILVKNDDGWHAFEVKSSLSISETYLQDAALQYYVITGSGLPLQSFTLIYVNEEYVLEGELDIHRLFTMKDVSKEVDAMLSITKKQIEEAKATLQLQSSPPIPIGTHCYHPYPCDFIGHCWKHVTDDSVLHMQSLTLETRFNLYYKGIERVSQINDLDDFETETQLEIQSFVQGGMVSDEQKRFKLIDELQEKMSKPVYFKLLTKEAALPVIPFTKPYSFPPVALSYGDNRHSVLLLFEETEQDIHRFFNIVSKLIDEFSLLITDDLTDLYKLLNGFPKAEFTDQFIAQKFIGIRQFIEETSMFHPQLTQDADISIIAGILGVKSRKLTHPLYILKDIENDTISQGQAKVSSKMGAYLYHIQAAFDLLVRQPTLFG